MQRKKLFLTRRISLTIFPCLESPKDDQLVGIESDPEEFLANENGNVKLQSGGNKESLK
jgi:hypothetical protein